MNRQQWIIGFCSLMFLISGCTTTKVFVPVNDASRVEALKPGDKVRITKVDGSQLMLTVAEVGEQQFVGVDKSGTKHSVDWVDISSLEHKKVSPGKTVAAVGGTVAGVYLLVAVITAAGAAAILSASGP